MTEYTPRSSQDLNQLLDSSNLMMQPFTTNNGVNYVYSNDQIPYTTVSTVYPPYTTTYLPENHLSSSGQLSSESVSMTLPRHQTSTIFASTLSPQRLVKQTPLVSSPFQERSSPRRYSSSTRLVQSHETYTMLDTESQDSVNEESMMSEPVIPPMEGYPDVRGFDELMKSYVQDLSPKKQDKALIHARRAANIKIVLIDKKTTSVESAQFRFWVKKMFTLLPNDPKIPNWKKKICHEGKPVAIREKLFKILTMAHKQCQHGGRDKTSAQVRKVYSWVPKELISRFVKLCPTCQVRRGTARNSPPDSDRGSPPDCMDSLSPSQLFSPPKSRRSSLIDHHCYVDNVSSYQTNGYSNVSTSQNRWMSSASRNQHDVSIVRDHLNGHIPTSTNLLPTTLPHLATYPPTNLQPIHGYQNVIDTTYMGGHGGHSHHHY